MNRQKRHIITGCVLLATVTVYFNSRIHHHGGLWFLNEFGRNAFQMELPGHPGSAEYVRLSAAM
jgi:hypothetical protein